MIEQLQRLSRPPRSLSLFQRLFVLLDKSVVSQMGFFFGLTGGLFLLLFSTGTTIRHMIDFKEPLSKISATITKVKKTNTSINEERVLAFHYTYTSKVGTKYKGVSYSVERTWRKGDSVQIEYVTNNPKRSRIKGMDATPAGLIGLFVLFFPGLGWFVACIALLLRLKFIRLLRDGLWAEGRFLSRRVAPSRVKGGQTAYLMLLAFEDEEGREQKREVYTYAFERSEDAQPELFLYHPEDETNAAVLSFIPGSPKVDTQGHLRFSIGRSILWFILPLLNLVLFVLFLLQIVR